MCTCSRTCPGGDPATRHPRSTLHDNLLQRVGLGLRLILFRQEHRRPIVPTADDPEPPSSGGRVLAHDTATAVQDVALVDLARVVGRLPSSAPLIICQFNLVKSPVLAPVPTDVAGKEASGVLSGISQSLDGAPGDRDLP